MSVCRSESSDVREGAVCGLQHAEGLGNLTEVIYCASSCLDIFGSLPWEALQASRSRFSATVVHPSTENFCGPNVGFEVKSEIRKL
jgi:hypothetical protein